MICIREDLLALFFSPFLLFFLCSTMRFLVKGLQRQCMKFSSPTFFFFVKPCFISGAGSTFGDDNTMDFYQSLHFYLLPCVAYLQL